MNTVLASRVLVAPIMLAFLISSGCVKDDEGERAWTLDVHNTTGADWVILVALFDCPESTFLGCSAIGEPRRLGEESIVLEIPAIPGWIEARMDGPSGHFVIRVGLAPVAEDPSLLLATQDGVPSASAAGATTIFHETWKTETG